MAKPGKLNAIISSEEVNTGRQTEFDYLKGLFLFAIFFIHAFQVAGSGAGTEAAAYKIIYLLGSMTGAAIFIFVMGLGTRYSKAGAGDMVRSGGRLFLYQYLNNIAYVVSGALPYFVLGIFMDMSAATEEVAASSVVFLLYINIFFLAGGIYLVLALLKKLKAPVLLYVALGLVINVFSPSLIGLQTGYAVPDYILGGIFGGTVYASFSILNYLPYAFFGVAFGELLKRAKDKKRFYVIVCWVSAFLLALFSLWLFNKYPTFDSVYEYISRTYTKPDFMRTIANTSAVILIAGIAFFVTEGIDKTGYINRKIMYFSKHISKYYAIHPTFFLLAYGFNSFNSFGFWGCTVLFAACIFYTDALVRLYNWFLQKRQG